MGYPIPSGSFVEVSLKYQLAGQTCLNIGHWRWDHESDNADGPTVIDDLLSKFDADTTGVSVKLSLATTEDVQILKVVGQMIRPTRYARIERDPNVNQGVLEPPSTPPNWVATSTKRTEQAGPHAHGSLFTSGFPAESLAADRIAAGTVLLVDAYASRWGVTYPGPTGIGEWVPVIFNRAAPAQSFEITAVSTSSEPRSLRRRQLRVGI